MKTRTAIFILVIISLMPLLDLLHPGLPKGHDTPDHVARVANFYQSLSEGNLVPRWAANLNWGYGHPILMFLYPLPSYIASLFHAIGFSFVDSTKLVFAGAYIASLLAMYLFASTAWGALPGLFAAVLYGFAPYRFVDLYVRGAIGEHVAFIFPPLIFYGLLRVARNNRETLGGVITALSMAGLILSHNAIALMVLPLVFLYGIYLFFFFVSRGARSRFVGLSAWCLVLGFLLSAFFWVPAFLEGKYTLRDIVTKGDFTARFVPWQWFIVSGWNYGGGNELTKEIGLAQWVSIFGAFILFVRTKSPRLRWFIGGSVVSIIASLWLMTAGSKGIWESVTILQKFQFPWRLLTIPVILSSLLGAIVVAYVPKKRVKLLTIGSLLVALVSTRAMWHAKEYVVKPEAYYSGIYDGTTDTGESSPIWSVRFMERRPSAKYEVMEGVATIVSGLRTATRHEFTVSAKTDARIVDNTLYFPGWNVEVDSRPLDLVRELIYQDPNYRGLMTFRVPAGEHRVVVVFRDTKLRKTANLLSIGSLVSVVLYEAFRRYRHI